MPRHIDRTFDHRKPVLVRREFKSAGRTLKTGQPFDWQRMALDVRRVRLLYEGGYLGHDDDPHMPEALPEDITDGQDTVQSTDGQDTIQSTDGQDTVQSTDGQDTIEGGTDGEITVDAERDADLEIDSLSKLQDIATAEGVAIKTSKAAQREAIIAARDAKS